MKKYLNIIYLIIVWFSVIISIIFLILIRNSKYFSISNYPESILNKLTITLFIINLFISLGLTFLVIKKVNIHLISYLFLSISVLLLISFDIVSFIKTNFIVDVNVLGNSMEPNYYNFDVVSVKINKEVERGDVVIFNVSSDTNIYYRSPEVFIKRIIGLPGDSIKVVDGLVYLDDDYYLEDYFPNDYLTNLNDGIDFDGNFSYLLNNEIKNCLVIPDGYYFVLGDNRESGKSTDSVKIGLISEKQIIGVVIHD